jgi:hypothetical protein
MSQSLANVLKYLASTGQSEISLREKHEDLQELWTARQKITMEMNQAISTAVEQASAPYLAQLADIDENYAAILSLFSDLDQ